MLIQPGPSEPEDNSNQNFTETGDVEKFEEVTAFPASDQASEKTTAEEGPQEAFQESPVEEELPPEAQGETNGGPLGCCLGLVVGLFFSIFVGVVGIGPNLGYFLGYVLPFGALTDVRIATGCIAFLGTVICAYFGWRIGRRLYREYEPPIPKDRRRKSKRKPEPKEAREHTI